MSPERFVARPQGRPRAAVLVLSGSSGRIEHARVELLGRQGFLASSIRWFGGAGQPPGICEVPLETFAEELDRLAGECERLTVLGSSKGAEAALLVAARDPRVASVVAFAPTDVVWANVGPGSDGRDRPLRASWTSGGVPLPFVPYDEQWEPDDDPPSFVDLHRRSRTVHPEAVLAARIPVERIAASLVLVAGADDRVWDSVESAERIERRRPAGLRTTVVTHPAAGHRVVLPGEEPVSGGQRMRRGGGPVADAQLGAAAWPVLLPALAGER